MEKTEKQLLNGLMEIGGWGNCFPREDSLSQFVKTKLIGIINGKQTDYSFYEYGDGIWVLSSALYSSRHDFMCYFEGNTLFFTTKTDCRNPIVAEAHFQFSRRTREKTSS